jgi:hypothetical protein
MRREMAGVCRACFASDTSKLQARNTQVRTLPNNLGVRV